MKDRDIATIKDGMREVVNTERVAVTTTTTDGPDGAVERRSLMGDNAPEANAEDGAVTTTAADGADGAVEREPVRIDPEAHVEDGAVTTTAGGVDDGVERRPLLRDKPAAAPYPVAALLGFRPYVEAAQAMTQTPIELAVHGVLAALNYVLQAHADVNFGFGAKPISLYLVVSAESGSRKSSVDTICMSGLYKHQETLLVQAEIQGADVDGALSTIIVVTEPTVDAVLAHFARSVGSLILCNPEVGSMLGGYAFKPENLLSTVAKLCDCWDGKFTVSLRVTSPDRIVHGKRLNASLMGQPDVIARLYSPVAKGQGFTSRLLTCEPPSLIGTRSFNVPDPIDQANMEEFASVIQSILECPLPVVSGTRNVLRPRVLPLSVGAMRNLKTFADDIELECRPDGRFASVREFCAKAPEHASRLGATLALATDFDACEVGSEFIDAGIELTRWYAGEALRIAGGADDDIELREAKTLLEWMQAKGRRVFSLVEIYQRGPTAVRDAAKARKLIAVLVEHNWVERHDESVMFDGQRRREAWRLR